MYSIKSNVTKKKYFILLIKNFHFSLSYCLCTSGYTGIDCRIIDSCAYNPCTNNGICHQLTSTGDFSCQCLPNYSGLYCEILINICQLNTSLCSSTDICIPINKYDRYYKYKRKQFFYLVFLHVFQKMNYNI
jgi:hypothetical protein